MKRQNQFGFDARFMVAGKDGLEAAKAVGRRVRPLRERHAKGGRGRVSLQAEATVEEREFGSIVTVKGQGRHATAQGVSALKEEVEGWFLQNGDGPNGVAFLNMDVR